MLPSPVQAALDNFSQALAAAIGGSVAATPAAPPKWYRPTAAQTVDFAKRIGWSVADLDGDRQANAAPTTPMIVSCDGTAADAMTYAAFGFQPDGHRMLWPASNREAAREQCDRIYLAASPAAANAIIDGAGAPGVTNDLDYVMIMTGQVIGGGLMGTPRINAEAFQTVDAYVAYFMSATTPGPNAPGPGISTPG
jgi:hypothetical protein